jgi:quercetin dioxygenase-like cupin family protein
MIHTSKDYRLDIRTEMRGGSGDVKIEHLFEPGSELNSPFARMISRITLAPGCSIGFHRHDGEEEVFHIISGSAEADDNGTVVTLNPGDSILTGNGAGHGIKNAGSADLVMLAVIIKYN